MTIKEMIRNFLESDDYSLMTKEDLAIYFDIPISEYRTFFSVLRDMEKDGSLILEDDKYRARSLENIPQKAERKSKVKKKKRNKGDKYRKSEATIDGTLEGNQKGYCFLIPDDKMIEDVYIAKENRRGAMHLDRVRIRLLEDEKDDRSRQGEVVKILERNVQPIVGTYYKYKGYGFVEPDDKAYGTDIFIHKQASIDAKNKDKVVCLIDEWSKRHDRNPQGRIVEIIGSKGSKGVEISSIAYQYQLPMEFSERTKKQAKKIPQEVKEKKGRVNYQDLFTVTIDGEKAKDFDDAISIAKEGQNYRLYVHIADVSYYVKKGSAIDRDAYERGTSVYMLDRVIPMLPEELSNGICSLNPNQLRNTISCKMLINKRGKVLDYKLQPSLIKSDYRLVYTDVSDQLENKRRVYKDKRLIDKLKIMEELYEILKKKREDRGAIDFEIPEMEIDIDNSGRPLDIHRAERRVANKIIEEFMLVANETVAQHFHKIKAPFLYRIHEDPTMKKVTSLKEVLKNFDLYIDEVNPKAYQEIAESVKGKDQERVVNMLLLRSMSKARYSREACPHFGLSTDYYTHFTAPIRRYPDLIVHRIIREEWEGKLHRNGDMVFQRYLDEAADHLSERERNAEEAERTAQDLMSCIYMEKYLGEDFKGVVSGVTRFGIFVELDNTVEGLCPYRDMTDDYYVYDEDTMSAQGVDGQKKISMGDRVLIQVTGINQDRHEINFKLIKKLK